MFYVKILLHINEICNNAGYLDCFLLMATFHDSFLGLTVYQTCLEGLKTANLVLCEILLLYRYRCHARVSLKRFFSRPKKSEIISFDYAAGFKARYRSKVVLERLLARRHNTRTGQKDRLAKIRHNHNFSPDGAG